MGCMLVLFSCEGGLIPIEYTNLSEEDFPATAEDALAIVNSVYHPLSSEYTKLYNTTEYGYVQMSDLMGNVLDIRWPGRGPDGYSDFILKNWHDQSTYPGQIFYESINQLNSGTINLHRLEKVQDKLPAEQYLNYQAQIRLARAWLSFIFYDWWGPMPIVPLEALLNPKKDNVFPRASEQEYIDYINADLDFAIEHLEVRPEFGRYTKGTAQMLKCKLAMMTGDWVTVKSQCELLMNPEYEYALEEDYNFIFSINNERNQEIIYAIPVISAPPSNHQWAVFSLDPSYPTRNPYIEKWGILMGTWYQYDLYDSTDSRTNNMVSSYYTIDSVLYDREHPRDKLHRGPFFPKYDEDPAQNGSYQNHDIILFRYADVLLMWAEADNKLNHGPSAEAWNKLSEIRRRANALPIDREEYLDESSFDRLILEERLRELYCEGFSRQDLIRHRCFISHALDVIHYTAYESEAADHLIPLVGSDNKDLPEASFLYRLPLPSSYLQEGKGIIVQNPGY